MNINVNTSRILVDEKVIGAVVKTPNGEGVVIGFVFSRNETDMSFVIQPLDGKNIYTTDILKCSIKTQEIEKVTNNFSYLNCVAEE